MADMQISLTNLLFTPAQAATPHARPASCGAGAEATAGQPLGPSAGDLNVAPPGQAGSRGDSREAHGPDSLRPERQPLGNEAASPDQGTAKQSGRRPQGRPGAGESRSAEAKAQPRKTAKPGNEDRSKAAAAGAGAAKSPFGLIVERLAAAGGQPKEAAEQAAEAKAKPAAILPGRPAGVLATAAAASPNAARALKAPASEGRRLPNLPPRGEGRAAASAAQPTGSKSMAAGPVTKAVIGEQGKAGPTAAATPLAAVPTKANAPQAAVELAGDPARAKLAAAALAVAAAPPEASKARRGAPEPQGAPKAKAPRRQLADPQRPAGQRGEVVASASRAAQRGAGGQVASAATSQAPQRGSAGSAEAAKLSESIITQALGGTEATSPQQTASARSAAAQAADPPRPAPPVEQIIEIIQSRGARAGEQIIVQLNPPQLGRVRLTVRAEGQELRGVLEVDNPRTFGDLQREAPALIDRLAEGGVDLRRLEVQLSDQGRGDSANSAAQQGADGGQGMNERQAGSQSGGWGPDGWLDVAADEGDGEAPRGEVADGSINVWM